MGKRIQLGESELKNIIKSVLMEEYEQNNMLQQVTNVTEAMKEAIRYFEEEERKIQNNDMRGFQFSHEKLRDSLNVLFNYLKESIGAV